MNTRTKDVSLGKTEMHRHLKLWDLILLGISCHGRSLLLQEQLQQHWRVLPCSVSIRISLSVVPYVALFLQNLLLVFQQLVGHNSLYVVLGEFNRWRLAISWNLWQQFLWLQVGCYFRFSALRNYPFATNALNGTILSSTYIDFCQF